VFASEFDPALECVVCWKTLEEGFVSPADIRGIAREREPAKRPHPLAEQRADVLGHEAWNVDGVDICLFFDLSTEIVAVLERECALVLEGEHGIDVARHRVVALREILLWVAFAECSGFLDGVATRIIPLEGVVSSGLVGEHVGREWSIDDRLEHVGDVGLDGDTGGFFIFGCCPGAFDGVLEVVDALVAVARLDSPVDSVAVEFDGETDPTVHRHREGLCAAHSAEPASQNDLAAEVAVEGVACERGERFERALENALRADVRPGASGHLAVHAQSLGLEFVERLPVVPVAHEIRVGDEDSGRAFVRAKAPDGFARLDEQRFCVAEVA